ncbi:hypothetical protein MPER_13246, partial [Moniliophthora perniciosa FA553]
ESFIKFVTRREVMMHRPHFRSAEQNLNRHPPLYIFGADWQSLPPVFNVSEFRYPASLREWLDPVIATKVEREYLNMERGEIVVVIKYPGGLTADDMLIYCEQLVNYDSKPDV